MARDAILVTGGAGFAGAHLCQHLLDNTDWDVVVLDRITYAGSLERLVDVRRDYSDRLRFVFHDMRGQYPASVLHALGNVCWVIHNGAETHVERSLHDPETFCQSNVLGTLHTLEAARQLRVEHFVYVSTDEVLGAALDGVDFDEQAQIRPSNPYAASKAGGEALAFSYWKAFGLPVTITRTMNLFGERQHPEKFIPMTMRKIAAAEPLTIHGDVSGRSGARKWLHARNQASALLFLLHEGQVKEGVRFPVKIGQTFHIAGEEHTNLEIARLIADEMGADFAYEVRDFKLERPGHDFRYSLDDSKLRSLGWFPPVPFEESLRRTVSWSIQPQNAYWLEDGPGGHSIASAASKANLARSRGV